MTISPAQVDWVPQACTLPTVEQLVRVTEFDQFFVESVQRFDRPEPTRLDLLLTPGAERVARVLAARETGCCSFFTFGFHVTDIGAVMQVEVEARLAELTAVRDTLRAALAAGCDDLLECSESPFCLVPFDAAGHGAGTSGGRDC